MTKILLRIMVAAMFYQGIFIYNYKKCVDHVVVQLKNLLVGGI